MNTMIQKKLSVIKERIEVACKRCGRNPDGVKLLLATKTVPAKRIMEALEAGQTLIAENKVQELKAKYEALQGIMHENHFIGHLQTNKINELLKYGVTCIHSIDRLELAEKLDQRLRSVNKTMDILIQVNTSNEKSKFGVNPDMTLELISKIAQLDTLKIKGLMTIGLFSAEAERVRPCFRLLKQLQEVIAQCIPIVEMKELSMGMSGDLETAIEEGATIVRVGTAVFGQRQYSDSYYWQENKAK